MGQLELACGVFRLSVPEEECPAQHVWSWGGGVPLGELDLALTLRALSREGVIATAGWKEGMELRHLRANECTERHQHVYTHYARSRQGVQAVRYAEEHGWMPRVEGRVYDFDEIQELADDCEAERTGYFPIFTINPA